MMITFSKSFGKRRRQSRLRFKDDAFPTTRRGFRDAKLLEDGTHRRRRERSRKRCFRGGGFGGLRVRAFTLTTGEIASQTRKKKDIHFIV